MALHQPSHKQDQQSSHEDRHNQLKDVFLDRTHPSVRVVRQAQAGLINIIASYDDKKPATDPLARQNTLAKTIEVLAAQLRHLPDPVRHNFHIILADNGMSTAQIAAARNVINSANARLNESGSGEIRFHIAHAHKDPTNPHTATAAYARNKAFTLVRDMRRDDPRLSAPAFVTDDDAITLGVAHMHTVLTNGNGRIGAVAPLNRTTTDVVEKANSVLPELWEGGRLPSSSSAFRLFPGITDPSGLIDFCMVTAFGGTRVPKTCALMLDGDAVQSMQNDAGELFLVCPEGSFEDMLLSGGLERQGYKVVECAEAEVFDQVRVDPRARGLQQFRWAFDHATAFHDFVRIGEATSEGLVFHGVSVLEPGSEQWQLARIGSQEATIIQALNTDSISAAIVNPAEVRELLSRIEISLAHDPDHFIASHPYAFKGRAGSFRSEDTLQKTVRLCQELLEQVMPVMEFVKKDPVDVPVIAMTDLNQADQLRFELDCRIARILGNLAAIASMASNDIEAGTLRVALLGPRQPTQ